MNAVVQNKKISLSMAAIVACMIGVGVGVFVLNFWHASRCNGSAASDHTDKYIEAIQKRLLQAESQNIKNTIIMERLLYNIQSRLAKLESQEIEELTKTSQSDAVDLALLLASYPAPPIPDFPLDKKYEDAESLADMIDDTLSRKDDNYDYKMSSLDDVPSTKKIEPVISDTEAKKACNDWKTKYEVVIGVSWGKLPYDLQGKWMSYHCDLHLAAAR